MGLSYAGISCSSTAWVTWYSRVQPGAGASRQNCGVAQHHKAMFKHTQMGFYPGYYVGESLFILSGVRSTQRHQWVTALRSH